MKLWMRKIAVALIAVITLGLYIPDFDIDVEAEQSKETAGPDLPEKTDVLDEEESAPVTKPALETEPDVSTTDNTAAFLTERAKEQVLFKMGPRIVPKMEGEFQTVIFPKMEESIELILANVESAEAPNVSIAGEPAEGTGERIFNLRDERTGQLVAKFHVRRDRRPQEGYWFNFHYHVSSDGFQKHHDIGEVYWDKNTPPEWMA
ncbi:YpjP family protein [Lentibacillus juripiscarius]|uniref:YpjP family protein n=1 Tax=Lentibacillus juripiscarius TaxID=257446 RepID=A0ABW5V5N0_9BACI